MDAVALHTLQTRLDSFATCPAGADLVEEADSIFKGLKGTEGRHITRALQERDFPFQSAQALLGDCFQAFARVAHEVLDSWGHLLGSDDRARLEELAFLASHTPLASPKTLKTIRRVREATGRHRRPVAN